MPKNKNRKFFENQKMYSIDKDLIDKKILNRKREKLR